MPKFTFNRSGRSTLWVTMLACAAFVVLAIKGWGLPASKVAVYGLFLLGLMLLIMLAAFGFVLVMKLLPKWLAKKPERFEADNKAPAARSEGKI